ncbi:phosphorylase family protein [Saccharopolyspora rosea]|uniref:Nucleoside phosphorylase domain-containing protein n=1 Tax=Saccharopolyspora rosea TaxID=524884 RepID=A0ABW3FVQ9_9PSEU|nr:hypothetical protein [Saccharopolyspora rosea]
MASKLLICAPLRVEASALRGALRRPAVHHTGLGPRRSERAAAQLAEQPFDAMVVAGLAGGVGTAVRSGDVVVADEVRGPGGTLPCPAGPGVADALRRLGFPVHCGPIVTADHVVRGAQRAEFASTGALAVDMESAVLGAAAGDRPLVVVRVVLDTAWQPLLRPGTPRRTVNALARLHGLAREIVRATEAHVESCSLEEEVS